MDFHSGGGGGGCAPATVPWMTVPFFSSTCTVSLASFIRNLRCGSRNSSRRWAGQPQARQRYARTHTSTRHKQRQRAALHEPDELDHPAALLGLLLPLPLERRGATPCLEVL